jgi:hypothetical protein
MANDSFRFGQYGLTLNSYFLSMVMSMLISGKVMKILLALTTDGVTSKFLSYRRLPNAVNGN